MAAENYGVIEDGVCTSVIVLDPEATNVEDFARALGKQLLRVSEHAGGAWGIGATYDGVTLTPAAPQVDDTVVQELPEDYIAPVSDAERIANLEETVDWLVAITTGTEGAA